MHRELTSKLGTVSLAALLLAVPQLATAQEADVTPLNADIGFIFTTFMFLVSGFLVFFMAAGFAMLEAGLVRGKNVAMQLTKNMALFSLSSLFFTYWDIISCIQAIAGPFKTCLAPFQSQRLSL